MDALRVLAILFVLLTHAHELAGVSGSLEHKLYCIDRLGVPLFLMISGALIVPRAAEMGVMAFYKKRIVQFVVVIAFWSVATNTVYNLLHGDGVQAVVKAVMETNGLLPAALGHAHHLGYMYAILGLYLLAPFFSRGLVGMAQGARVWMVCLLLILQFPPCSFARAVNDCGSVAGYALYFLAGYVLSRFDPEQWCGRKKVLACLCCGFPLLVLGSYFCGGSWYTQNVVFYLSAACLFLLFQSLWGKHQWAGLQWLSKSAFCVYLVHLCVMYVLNRTLPVWDGSAGQLGHAALLFAVSAVVSWSIAAMLLKVKWLRYLVA